MKLIDKDALVAEIERRIKEHHSGYLVCLKDILSFLDTLEVKDVNLNEEINAYMDNEMKFLSDEIGYDTFSTIAKHFFELGLKVAQEGK